jgi:hypothetical protein
MSGATSGLNEIFVHSRSPLREIGEEAITNSRPRSSCGFARERTIELVS